MYVYFKCMFLRLFALKNGQNDKLWVLHPPTSIIKIAKILNLTALLFKSTVGFNLGNTEGSGSHWVPRDPIGPTSPSDTISSFELGFFGRLNPGYLSSTQFQLLPFPSPVSLPVLSIGCHLPLVAATLLPPCLCPLPNSGPVVVSWCLDSFSAS